MEWVDDLVEQVNAQNRRVMENAENRGKESIDPDWLMSTSDEKKLEVLEKLIHSCVSNVFQDFSALRNMPSSESSQHTFEEKPYGKIFGSALINQAKNLQKIVGFLITNMENEVRDRWENRKKRGS